MAAALQCSDRATFQRLFAQGGTAAEVETLALHLEHCPRCGELFEDMIRQDHVALGLFRPGSAAAEPDSSAVKNLRARLARIRPAPGGVTTAAGFDAGETGAALPAVLPMSVTDVSLAFLSPPQQPDEIGRLGPYRVLKQLGAGGMGMVLLAEDTMLQRKVALKTMLPQIALNKQARERFLREARAAAAIEHPHVIAIHQVGEDNGVPFLAMPFLKGESLDDRLKRDKKLPLNEAVRITAEIAEGLAAAHARGLIHRDIKPGNVWLEEQPAHPAPAGVTTPAARRPFKVKVLDFGLARSLADETHLTHSGAIVGTPAFMAPEQARAESVDGRADLFSLGCVLYVMLTGQRPFTGETTMAILAALALDTPPAPREVNPAVPAALSDFTMRLLAKKPEERPASADAVLEELRNLVRAAAEAKKAAAPVPPRPAQIKKATPSSVSPPAVAKKAAPALVVPPPRPAAASPRRRVALLVGLALLFLIGGGFAAYQLIFKTKDGTLTVEVDGDAEVSFKNGILLIRDEKGELKYTLKASERNRTLPPGKYLVEVAGADGLKVVTDKFEIVRNDKTTVRVSVDATVVAAKPNDPGRRAVEWLSSLGPKNLPAPGAITQLDLSGKHVTDADLVHLKALPLVNALCVKGDSVTDAGLEHLKTVKLTSLVVNSKKVTDASLENLGVWPETLEHLDLSSTSLTDAGLAHMKRLSKLEVIILFEVVTVSDDGLKELKGLTKLRILNLHCPRVTDAGLQYLKSLTNLESLALSYSRVSDTGLEHLYELRKLKALNLWDTKVTADGVAALHKALPQCKIEWTGGVIEPSSSPDADRKAAEWVLSLGGGVTIRVGDNERYVAAAKDLPAQPFRVITIGFAELPRKEEAKRVTDAGLQNLEGLTGLVWLDLSRTAISDAGLVHLKRITTLRAVPLNDTNVSDAGMKHLTPLVELDQLHFRDTKIGDAGLEHLKSLTNVKKVYMDGNPLTDTGLAYLAANRNLEVLCLIGTQVTDAGLQHLTAFPNLTDLQLMGTPTGDEGLEHLKAVPKLKSVFFGRNLTNAGVIRLKALCPQLTYLGLDSPRLTDTALVTLKEWKTLRSVEIARTGVTDAGLAHLTEIGQLRDLVLFDNPKVTADGAKKLAAALPGCRVTWNGSVVEPQVTADGVKKLAAALPGCKIEWDGGTIEPKK